MIEILGVALLVVGVLGGLACGPWLVAAAVARRRDDGGLAAQLVRRASWSAIVLGVLAVVFPLGRAVEGAPYLPSSYGLTVAGLVLLAAGLALRRFRPIS